MQERPVRSEAWYISRDWTESFTAKFDDVVLDYGVQQRAAFSAK